MIYAYLKEDEVNGFSSSQELSYKTNHYIGGLPKHRYFFDFPVRSSIDQQYVYPILLDPRLCRRLVGVHHRGNYAPLSKRHIFYIPTDVLEDINTNKCKLVFDYSSEPYDITYNNNFDLTDHLINKTMDYYSLKKDQVILLTGNFLAYKQKNYLVCITPIMPSTIPIMTSSWINEKKYSINNNSILKYKMLSLMYTTKKHRIKFAYDLFYNNLREENLITCHLYNTQLNNRNFAYLKNNIPELHDNLFLNSLPWVYDDPVRKTDLLNETEEQLYKDSYVNFVIESFIQTLIKNNKQYELDISEKVFKPLARMQPFVVYGQTGILSHLKSMGYKTFDRWWDESYDQTEDHDERYKKIFELFKWLNSKSKQELADMLREMLPTLEHNINVFNSYITNKEYLAEFTEVLALSFDK